MANIKLLQLARRQFGVAHLDQLTGDVELTRSQIHGLVHRGELLRILPSTYRLVSHPDTFLARALATQLWAGGVGFLSSWSAARVYGLRKMPADVVHFTVPADHSRRTPKWIHLDRTSWCAPDDRRTLSTGLVVPGPERMLFGLAGDVNQHRFDRAAEDAWHRKLITPDSLGRFLDRHRRSGRNGVRRIETWLHHSSTRTRPAQSHLEMLLLEACEAIGLPPATRQHPVRLSTGEVIHLDIAWPDICLAVESGDAWFHGGDAEHDRDQASVEIGWTVIRLDDTNRSDPVSAARRVRRAHERRSADLGHVVASASGASVSAASASAAS